MFDPTASGLAQVLRRYNMFALCCIFLVGLDLMLNIAYNVALINGSKTKKKKAK